MHFMIIAKDAQDAGTLDKRLAARNTHMQGIKTHKLAGSILDGGAILNDEGQMCGSAVFCEFESRDALNRYLEEEVYMREGVWHDIQIYPVKRVDWDTLLNS
ncbi:YciI family protein [Halomonas sp.]|uniref:YciI family protein n=1 Tax=Halomonas sp. TaxID=1486246 RepID=UPI003A91337D